MAENSAIEWTDHTFNPWWGCVEVSPACDHCYARTFAKRVGVAWGKESRRRFFLPKHWAEPFKWDRAAERDGVRRRVFCASMADVFEYLPDSHPDAAEMNRERGNLWCLIESTPNLDWLLLSKRPQNMTRMAPERWRSGWPSNVIAMTTAENQHYADVRIPELLKVPARRRGLSCEPLLGPVELSNVTRRSDCVAALGKPALRGIDWVIVGGESGPKARPMHPHWVRSLRDQCVTAGVAFHFKQWGEWKPISQMADGESDSLYVSKRVARPGEGHTQCDLDDVYGRRCTVKTSVIQIDGRTENAFPPGAMTVFRVGKKAGGRTLDGRTWDQMPEVK